MKAIDYSGGRAIGLFVAPSASPGNVR